MNQGLPPSSPLDDPTQTQFPSTGSRGPHRGLPSHGNASRIPPPQRHQDTDQRKPAMGEKQPC